MLTQGLLRNMARVLLWWDSSVAFNQASLANPLLSGDAESDPCEDKHKVGRGGHW